MAELFWILLTERIAITDKWRRGKR